MEQVTSPPCYSLISSSTPSSQKLSQTIRRAGGRKCGPGRRERKLCAGSGNVNLRSRDAEQHGASSKRVHKTELPVIRKPRSRVRTRRKRNRYLENSSPLRGHGSPIHNRRDVDTTSSPWREGEAAHVRSLGQDREGNAAAPASTDGGTQGHCESRTQHGAKSLTRGTGKSRTRGPGLGGGLQGERRRSHATRFRLHNYYVPRI